MCFMIGAGFFSRLYASAYISSKPADKAYPLLKHLIILFLQWLSPSKRWCICGPSAEVSKLFCDSWKDS